MTGFFCPALNQRTLRRPSRKLLSKILANQSAAIAHSSLRLISANTAFLNNPTRRLPPGDAIERSAELFSVS